MASNALHEKTRTEPHPISDSESEVGATLSVKKKRPLRKTKMAATEQLTSETGSNSPSQMEAGTSNSMGLDLVEMRKICAEMKEASERSAATLREFKEAQDKAHLSFTQTQMEATRSYPREEDDDTEMAATASQDLGQQEYDSQDYQQHWEAEEDNSNVECMQPYGHSRWPQKKTKPGN